MKRRRMMMAQGGKEEIDYSTRYFTLKALQAGSFSHSNAAVYYSINGGKTWNSLRAGASTPTVQAGTKVMFRGNITPSTSYGVGKFTGTGDFEVEGNVMSLLFASSFVGKVDLTGYDRAFLNLFNGVSHLKSAKRLSLPATTLSSFCYGYMFYGCTSLTDAPELPATTLAVSCYHAMFYNCSSLTTSPELPSTTLASMCYYTMFGGTNLLPDTSNIDFTSKNVVASGGLYGLFYNTKVTYNDLCNILPMHNNKPCLPVLELSDNCYTYMFAYCQNLTSAPELPATALASMCYANMFSHCSSLTSAPELPATALASMCYANMFESCTSLTVAPELPATTLASYCYSSMFVRCTSLTTAPELPATGLANYCYQTMFYKCTNLNYIKAMFTTDPSDTYTKNWVYNVASSGTFVKNSAAMWNVTGANGVPSGWTVETAAA